MSEIRNLTWVERIHYALLAMRNALSWINARWRPRRDYRIHGEFFLFHLYAALHGRRTIEPDTDRTWRD